MADATREPDDLYVDAPTYVLEIRVRRNGNMSVAGTSRIWPMPSPASTRPRTPCAATTPANGRGRRSSCPALISRCRHEQRDWRRRQFVSAIEHRAMGRGPQRPLHRPLLLGLSAPRPPIEPLSGGAMAPAVAAPQDVQRGLDRLPDIAR